MKNGRIFCRNFSFLLLFWLIFNTQSILGIESTGILKKQKDENREIIELSTISLSQTPNNKKEAEEDFNIFDLFVDDMEWSERASMHVPRSGLGVVQIEGKIYAIGGYNGKYLNIVEEYDPLANEWVQKTDMPTSRSDFGIAVANGKIYAIGGHNKENRNLNVVEEYNPKTDTWTTKKNMLTSRWGLTACECDGKIYAIGGHENWEVEEYDPVKNNWIRKRYNMDLVCNSASVSADGKIYVIGGAIYTGHYEEYKPIPWLPMTEYYEDRYYIDSIYEYTPISDEWVEVAKLNCPREKLSAAILNNMIFIIGGFGEIDTKENNDKYEKYEEDGIFETDYEGIVTEEKIEWFGEDKCMIGAYDIHEYYDEFGADSISKPISSLGIVILNNSLYIIGGEQTVLEHPERGVMKRYFSTVEKCKLMPDKDNNDSFDASKNIKTNMEVIEEINSLEDEDFFRFIPEVSGRYTINNTGILKCSAYLYDNNKKQIAAGNIQGKEKNFSINCNLNAKQVYYLKVNGMEGNLGEYKLKVAKDDYSNGFEYSEEVEVGKIISGKLEYIRDEDVFKFNAEANKVYVIESIGKTDTIGALFNSNFIEIVKDDNSGSENNFRIKLKLPNNETYYIKVSGLNKSNNNGYSIKVKVNVIFNNKLKYEYSKDGLLEKIYDDNGVILKQFIYDQNGNLKEIKE